MPKSLVVDTIDEGREFQKYRYPWNGMPIYELHVKGFTIQHPEVPADIRGTYAGLCAPPVIEYLRGLGVTTVELMPVHQFVFDGMLQGKGLTNYWGYASIGFFEDHWGEGETKSLAVFLNGDGLASTDPRGEPMRDDSFYVIFNAHHEPRVFRLPVEASWGKSWVEVLDTSVPELRELPGTLVAGEEVAVDSRALMVLRRVG